jgi:hypothetical protein
MKNSCCYSIVLFGLAFCLGCGDSSTQRWEDSKPQASKEKSGKSDDVANNDTAGNEAGDNDKSADSHGTVNPHGANPHAGMQMPGETSSEPMENDGKLDLDSAHWTVPKTWIRKSPGPMLLAEYAIPKAEADKENGRLTVMQAGGSVENNVDRWKGQFSKLEKQKQETFDIGKVKITFVDFSGTFNESRGMMGPSVTRPNYRMLAAIAEVPGENTMIFAKSYGPEKTIATHADEIKAFIRSLKVDKQ